jgi:cytoskeletal protein CcmA (bactofilin family)
VTGGSGGNRIHTPFWARAIQGNLAATERIAVAPTAAVSGDLIADRIVLFEGATFSGRIDMDNRTIASKVASTRPLRRPERAPASQVSRAATPGAHKAR